tara:strand:- start:555 stop:1520 length:966 start_codon:yes stop_codon:yes gene_type:complete
VTTEKRSRSGATPDSIRRLGILSAIFLIAVVVVTLVSLPWTFGHEVIEGQTSTARRFEATNPELALQPPSFAGESPYLLGSDHLGRDLLSRVLAGGGISLIVGLAAASTAVLLGGLWGMVAATSSPRVDGFMMRIVDVLYGLPYILIVVLLVVAVEGLLERTGVVLGSAEAQWVNVLTLWIAIGAVSWLTMARVIRGQVLSLRSQPFMEACRAIGVPWKRQVWRHLLPNVIGPIAVYATLTVPMAMLSEAFLSFLGIGIREPLPSWGNLAAAGLSEINGVRSHWWLLVWPCLLIALTLLSLNCLGEWLRVRLDPRQVEQAS